MIFSRALMMAGLTVTGWLLLFTGALMLILTIVQYVRGDVDARPLVTMLGGAAFLAAGFACRWAADRMRPQGE